MRVIQCQTPMSASGLIAGYIVRNPGELRERWHAASSLEKRGDRRSAYRRLAYDAAEIIGQEHKPGSAWKKLLDNATYRDMEEVVRMLEVEASPYAAEPFTSARSFGGLKRSKR